MTYLSIIAVITGRLRSNVMKNLTIASLAVAPMCETSHTALAASALPDLVVGSLSYSRTAGAFTSVVSDQGGPVASAVWIGVAYFVDGVQCTYGGVTQTLAAGASVTIGSHSCAISAGQHTITAVVNDTNLIAESVTTNNTLSQTITIPSSVQAVSLSSFTNSIGIGTHMHDNFGGNAYTNVPMVESALNYLGIKHDRECFCDSYAVQTLTKMNQDLGITYDILVDSGNYTAEMAFIQANAGIVEAVEGANEANQNPQNWDGNTTLYAAVLQQMQMRQDLAANSSTANIPLYSMTITSSAAISTIGNITPYCDQVAIHSYPQYYGNQSVLTTAQYLINVDSAMAPTKPLVVTESGFWTQPSPTGVPETIQAKLILSDLLDNFALGITRTYLYELFDEFYDPTGVNRPYHLGLFEYNGTPKPSAVALRNMQYILADTGSPNNVGSLAFTTSGLPATAHSLVFERSDGVFVVALWNDAPIWDNVAYTPITVPSALVKLTPQNQPSSMSMYDPLVGQTATQQVNSATSISVTLPDHPVFVFIKP